MMLAKSQSVNPPLDLREVMEYALTPVPLSLGTPDGFFNTTNKATMLKYFLKDISKAVQYPLYPFYIQDGNALFHSLTKPAETIEGICLQLLDTMVAETNFIFSTDSYFQQSIKSLERLRRGSSQPYPIEGPSTSTPADFKDFLKNDKNKMQLCQNILKVWSSTASASRLAQCGIAIVVVEGKAFQLKSTNKKVKAQKCYFKSDFVPIYNE